ncbi:hypothetical protein LZ31DRAFT_179898 [Colletotrichum somersetense]|nr:hypothetical protein LZ31DRAFT_179898 [Colletotrichum somersetense]
MSLFYFFLFFSSGSSGYPCVCKFCMQICLTHPLPRDSGPCPPLVTLPINVAPFQRPSCKNINRPAIEFTFPPWHRLPAAARTEVRRFLC